MPMFKYILVVLLGLLPLSAEAAPTHWTIVPAKSHLTFTGTQQGAPFDGRFTGFAGAIDFDPASPPTGHADITVEMKTATTDSPDRDGYLPQPNWFDAVKFPQAHYVIQSFAKMPDGQYVAHGQLKIRDITLPLALPFTLTIDGATAHATGQAQLKRLAYGVGQGEWKDTSSVGDAVTVKIDVVATH